MIGEVINDKPIASHLLAVVIQRRAEVVAPMAGGESVVLVESAVVGMVRSLRTVVPLAERTGRVASGLKRIRDRRFVRIQPFLAAADATDTGARVVSTGKKLRTSRRTDLANVESARYVAPSRASESIFGVARFVLPLTLKSPQPWSSVKITNTLG